MLSHTHTHTCPCVLLDPLTEVLSLSKSSIFDLTDRPFQYFSEPKNASWSDGPRTENNISLSRVSTLGIALNSIGMCSYHPLNNYSYDTWFKSTLHSLVNSMHSIVRIFIFLFIPEVFFLFFFFYNKLSELNSAFTFFLSFTLGKWKKRLI